MPGLGKLLVLAGIGIALLGVLLVFADRIPWLGRLPGDISVTRGSFSLYAPLTTCLLLSLLVSLLLYFFRK